ncbi:single-stranded DNA-binding protein [Planococcus kocurii]|uniref:single-stranded DNA-binding protein n=1 Tax=Planococcus kocurii TaxID=1374 RepID=UPI003D07E36A
MIESRKRWRLTTPDEQTVQEIQKELNLSSVLAKILVTRGLNTADAARTFMQTDATCMHDPYLMKDMDLAVERIRQAIDNQEKIVVYGDYDAGATRF